MDSLIKKACIKIYQDHFDSAKDILSADYNGENLRRFAQKAAIKESFSLASAVGGFIYMAFVAPLQAGQRKAQEVKP